MRDLNPHPSVYKTDALPSELIAELATTVLRNGGRVRIRTSNLLFFRQVLYPELALAVPRVVRGGIRSVRCFRLATRPCWERSWCSETTERVSPLGASYSPAGAPPRLRTKRRARCHLHRDSLVTHALSSLRSEKDRRRPRRRRGGYHTSPGPPSFFSEKIGVPRNEQIRS